MQQTTLNDTGETIPVIGFGGMPLSIQGRPPEEAGRVCSCGNRRRDDASSTRRTSTASTTRDIGHNERLIASVLRERDREQDPRRDEGAVCGVRAVRGRTTAPEAHSRSVRAESARARTSRSGSINFTLPIRRCRSRRAWKRSRSCSAKASFASRSEQRLGQADRAGEQKILPKWSPCRTGSIRTFREAIEVALRSARGAGSPSSPTARSAADDWRRS
jgi:hypothetical protein